MINMIWYFDTKRVRSEERNRIYTHTHTYQKFRVMQVIWKQIYRIDSISQFGTFEVLVIYLFWWIGLPSRLGLPGNGGLQIDHEKLNDRNEFINAHVPLDNIHCGKTLCLLCGKFLAVFPFVYRKMPASVAMTIHLECPFRKKSDIIYGACSHSTDQ